MKRTLRSIYGVFFSAMFYMVFNIIWDKNPIFSWLSCIVVGAPMLYYIVVKVREENRARIIKALEEGPNATIQVTVLSNQFILGFGIPMVAFLMLVWYWMGWLVFKLVHLLP